MKTPKQLKRWLYKARLRPEGNGKGHRSRYLREGCFSFQGHGRRWRIRGDIILKLDVSCPIGEFDRWANSTEQTVLLAICEKDFVNTVRRINNVR